MHLNLIIHTVSLLIMFAKLFHRCRLPQLSRRIYRPCTVTAVVNRSGKLFVNQKKALRNVFGVRRPNKHQHGNTKRVFNENNVLTVLYGLYYKFILAEGFRIMNAEGYPTLLRKHFQTSDVNKQRFICPRFYYKDELLCWKIHE